MTAGEAPKEGEGERGTGLLWDCFVNWSLTLEGLAEDSSPAALTCDSRSRD